MTRTSQSPARDGARQDSSSKLNGTANSEIPANPQAFPLDDFETAHRTVGGQS